MPYEAYDVETRQYPLCLGDCFYLPAALQVKTCLETRIQVKKLYDFSGRSQGRGRAGKKNRKNSRKRGSNI